MAFSLMRNKMALGTTVHTVVARRGGDSPVAIGRPRSRAVVVLSAALLLIAVVALSSFSGRQSSSLDESEEYLRVPKRLANLAADHDDRDGLASIMRTGHEEAIREASAAQKPRQQLRAGRQYGRREEQRRPAVKKWSKNQIAEQHAKDMNAREENNMMSDATMVPWVRWPKRDEAQYRDTAHKQQLLQMPMLMGSDVKDNAAHMLPLSAIMNRLSVDSKLHQGEVSDTQLAMADASAIRKHPEQTSDKKSKLDCKPFC